MKLFENKKGQGLSLTVIIVAALALIVLVVLVLIFTGRMAGFSEDVGKEGTANLVKLQITYGKCHPTNSDENAYLNAMEVAGDDQDAKDSAYDTLVDEVERCKSQGTDEINCESFGCKWG